MHNDRFLSRNRVELPQQADSIVNFSRLLKMQLKWALAPGWRCLRV
jgi:hypothetical protein